MRPPPLFRFSPWYAGPPVRRPERSLHTPNDCLLIDRDLAETDFLC